MRPIRAMPRPTVRAVMPTTHRTDPVRSLRGIFSGYDPGVEAPPLFGDEPIFWFGDVEIEDAEETEEE